MNFKKKKKKFSYEGVCNIFFWLVVIYFGRKNLNEPRKNYITTETARSIANCSVCNFTESQIQQHQQLIDFNSIPIQISF